MILGVSEAPLKVRQKTDPEFSLPVLPAVEAEGPRYVLEKGSQDNEMALKFMDVLHDLYETEGLRLKEAHLLRKKNRQIHKKRIKANPPRPKDTTIHFWSRNSSRDIEPSPSK